MAVTRLSFLIAILSLTSCRGGALSTAEMAHASAELSPLPGRDLLAEERAPVARLIDQIGDLRKRKEGPPIVRVVPADVLRERAGDRVYAGPEAIGLKRQSAIPEAMWWAEAGVVLAAEGALESDAFREALALSSGPLCVPADPTTDAADAADAIARGVAQVALMEHALVSDGVGLLDAAPDPALVAAHLRAGGDAVAASRAAGTVTALRLYGAGAWRTLDRACAAPPASVSAVLHPEWWEMGIRPISLAPPQVPAWEDEGFHLAGTDRLGEAALGEWLESALALDPALAASWRGDALSVYRRGDERRVAWAISLVGHQRRGDLLAALHRRVLPDGRALLVDEGPGNTAILLIGGDGEAIAAPGAPDAGRDWPHPLRAPPDARASAMGRQAAARSARFARGAGNGVVQLGDARLALPSNFSASPGAVPGRGVRLERRKSGLVIEMYRTASWLTGHPERAAGDLIALARERTGVREATQVREVRHGALARVAGVGRLSRYEVVEVFAVPVGEDVVIAHARWRGGRAEPPAWRELKARLRAL